MLHYFERWAKPGDRAICGAVTQELPTCDSVTESTTFCLSCRRVIQARRHPGGLSGSALRAARARRLMGR
jgi:hypothetical protein